MAVRYGTGLTEEEASGAMHKELSNVCAQVLRDAGVYKQDAAGRAGLQRFLDTVGLTR